MSRIKVALAGAVLAAFATVGVAGPAAASTETECEAIFSPGVCAQVEGALGTVVGIVESFDEPSEIADYVYYRYKWLQCRVDPTSCGS